MNRIPSKSSRLRLAPKLYEHLRHQVLRRDGWRCQSCGTLANLKVHHRELRSQSGDDAEQNLITLCTRCHSIVHRGSNARFAIIVRKGTYWRLPLPPKPIEKAA